MSTILANFVLIGRPGGIPTNVAILQPALLYLSASSWHSSMVCEAAGRNHPSSVPSSSSSQGVRPIPTGARPARRSQLPLPRARAANAPSAQRRRASRGKRVCIRHRSDPLPYTTRRADSRSRPQHQEVDGPRQRISFHAKERPVALAARSNIPSCAADGPPLAPVAEQTPPALPTGRGGAVETLQQNGAAFCRYGSRLSS